MSQQTLKTIEQIGAWILAAGGIAGAIAAIVKLGKPFCEWIRNKMRQRKQNKEMPQRLMRKMESIGEQLSDIKNRLDNNDDATSTMMLEKMMWAYDYYVLKGNKIPLNVQTALCVMFDQYTSSGRHNHIPIDFKDKILNCDVER